MQYWIFKSEPDTYGIDHLAAAPNQTARWDGIRNYQARNNRRAMRLGDLGFFYHSNIGKEIVGIVEVCAESAPDSTTDDPRWDCVHIRALRPLQRPVTLDTCKVQPGLENMALVKSMRLSVQPVTPEEWRIVCALGGVDP